MLYIKAGSLLSVCLPVSLSFLPSTPFLSLPAFQPLSLRLPVSLHIGLPASLSYCLFVLCIPISLIVSTLSLSLLSSPSLTSSQFQRMFFPASLSSYLFVSLPICLPVSLPISLPASLRVHASLSPWIFVSLSPYQSVSLLLSVFMPHCHPGSPTQFPSLSSAPARCVSLFATLSLFIFPCATPLLCYCILCCLFNSVPLSPKYSGLCNFVSAFLGVIFSILFRRKHSFDQEINTKY